MVGHDFDVAFVIGNFGGFEADVGNSSLEPVRLRNYRIAYAKLIFDNNS